MDFFFFFQKCMCKSLWGKENQINNLGYKNAKNEFYALCLNPRGKKADIKSKNHYGRLTIIC